MEGYMPEFIISALVDPIEKEMNRYMDTIPESTARRRIRKSFARTDAFLAEFPLIKEISRNILSGQVTISTAEDISEQLTEREFAWTVIEEDGRKVSFEEYRLYSIHKTTGDTEINIDTLVASTLGGKPVEGVGMYLIPVPSSRYNSATSETLPPWLAVMNKITEVMNMQKISAVIGIHKSFDARKKLAS